MKKLLFLLLIFAGSLFAQPTVTFTTGVHRDTLNATTRDTLTLKVPTGYAAYTITIKTVSDTDTVYVDTKTRLSKDGFEEWSQKALVNTSTGSIVGFITATTTPTEYKIYDGQVVAIRIRSTDAVVTSRFIIQGKPQF